jgi:hypothetical protein
VAQTRPQPDGSSSSSSSSNQQQAALLAGNCALGLQVPHVVSLLLTLLKSAVALRNADSRDALCLASHIANVRVETGAADWLHAPQDPPKADIQQIRSMSINELRSRLKQVQARQDLPEVDARLGAVDMDQLPDSNLRMLMAILPDETLQQLLAPQAPPRVGASTRCIGHCMEAEQMVGEGFFTFQPGGISSSSVVGSNASGNVMWYNEQMANVVIPWLAVAARSVWLMGQILSDLLPGSSSSSSSSSCSGRPPQVSPGVLDWYAVFFKMLLESAFSCCEWIGSQLSHMHLPGDADPLEGSSSSKLIFSDSSSSSSSSGSHVPEGSMPLLQQLLEQHAQLQYGMFTALQRCVAERRPAAAVHNTQVAAGSALLQHMWGDSLPGQLSAFGAAVAAALPVGWACNNAACTNLAKLSELQLVRGKAKVCGGCKLVRMCSAECQRQHWKAGHKKVCKALAAAASAAAAAAAAATSEGGEGSSKKAGSSGSSAADDSSSSDVRSERDTGAAPLKLPTSAAGAAALSVGELKTLVRMLSLRGAAAAVEKSDLVALLVEYLGLK